jgi:hypothetical protein
VFGAADPAIKEKALSDQHSGLAPFLVQHPEIPLE